MKTILPILLLTCLAVVAQVPAPQPIQPPQPVPQPGTGTSGSRALSAAEQARAAGIRRMLQSRTNTAEAAQPAQATQPNVGTNSSGGVRQFAPAVPPPTQMKTESGDTIMISPPPSSTNAPLEEMIPAGMIDFRNADLNQVLQTYAELVNRTILRPANLAAANQIFLKTQTELTRKEAVQALEAVLAMNGVAFINMGDKFVKAVPVANAGQAGGEISNKKASELPELGSYVTHVVQLAYIKPSEMVQVLQPFASAIPNPILPIDTSQILVLRDYSENVKRMLEMIQKIDIAVPSEYISEVIPIKYAKATEIASALNSLSSGGGATSVGAPGGGGTIGGSGGSSRGVQRSVGMGGYGSGYGGGYGNRYGSGFGTTPFAAPAKPMAQEAESGFDIKPLAVTPTPMVPGSSTGSSFTDRLRNIINKASSADEIVVLGQTKMIADERTNSLLIFASREDMKMIKDVVAKLDVVLAQVLIEAIIVEVSLGNDRDIGISYLQSPQSSGNFTGVGGINNTRGFNNFSDFASGSTNALSGGFSYLANWNNDLDVLVKAVMQNNRAKIIQRPRIQTSHNEPASLFVGESRPYPTGTFYGGAYGGSSSIQQLPIGVTLTVTPLINPDGLVVMEISQDIQSANGFVNIANVGDVPITSQKSAQAKVSVRDRDTIILGGLIENSKSRTRSGVPFLSEIPVLGFFFSANSTKERRNELIVMIRPTVLPTPEVAALTAKTERESLPLIREAEQEAAADEAAQLRKATRQERQRRDAEATRAEQSAVRVDRPAEPAAARVKPPQKSVFDDTVLPE